MMDFRIVEGSVRHVEEADATAFLFTLGDSPFRVMISDATIAEHRAVQSMDDNDYVRFVAEHAQALAPRAWQQRADYQGEEAIWLMPNDLRAAL